MSRVRRLIDRTRCRIWGHDPSWIVAVRHGVLWQPLCACCGRRCMPDDRQRTSTRRRRA